MLTKQIFQQLVKSNEITASDSITI